MIDKDYAGEGLYRENILDHFKSPRNAGQIGKPSAQHRESNPICGDDITVFLVVENDLLKDLKFQGTGCAISQSAMSMLSEQVIGKPVQEVLGMERKDVLSLINIPISPVRMKCALLGLVAVKRGLQGFLEKGVAGHG